jgi:hypothetical protein
MLGPTGTVIMDSEEIAGRFRKRFAPDGPGRWLWRTRDGCETVYWVRWIDYPHGRELTTFWADAASLNLPFMPSGVEELAALTYADDSPMGEWVRKVSELP